jgi:hypothetical protein
LKTYPYLSRHWFLDYVDGDVFAHWSDYCTPLMYVPFLITLYKFACFVWI